MNRILPSLVALLLAPLAALHAADTPKIAAVQQQTASALPAGFGAEVNPTGQPIGGGAGYTAGPTRADAARRVGTLEELRRALAKAAAGDVIWIESGSTIDFTGTRIEVPEKVTLAGRTDPTERCSRPDTAAT